MNLLDSLGIALTALRANMLRSILTTLGIIIGVASVIVMVAVGTGARSEVDRQIASLGSNMLVVFPGSTRVGGRAGGAGPRLRHGDLLVRGHGPTVLAAAAPSWPSRPVRATRDRARALRFGVRRCVAKSTCTIPNRLS